MAQLRLIKGGESAKTVNGLKLLTIVAKCSNPDV